MTMPRRGVRTLAGLLIVAGTALLPGHSSGTVGLVVPDARPALSAVPAGRPAVSAAPAVGQITAHDGKFWLGAEPIILDGTNASVPCCTALEYARIRSWGMNFVRLHFQWSRLEVTPPVQQVDGTWTHTYDSAYVSSLLSSVARAQRAGLYVMVESHACQCAFFGFPEWQYLASYNSHGISYGHTLEGFNQAKTDFWSDQLRQEFMIDALEYVAFRLRTKPGVAGYELLNEPQQGLLPDTASTTATILDWQLRAAQAVRAVDPNRIVFFTTRSGYGPGLPDADLSGFQELGNTAFDLHDYFGGRWGTGLLENPASPNYHETLQGMFNHVLFEGSAQPPYEYIGTAAGQVRFLQNALDSLAPWGIPLVVGEFGNRGDAGVYLYFGSVTAALTHLGVSWTSSTYDGNEGFVNPNGTLKPWAYLVIEAAGGSA